MNVCVVRIGIIIIVCTAVASKMVFAFEAPAKPAGTSFPSHSSPGGSSMPASSGTGSFNGGSFNGGNFNGGNFNRGNTNNGFSAPKMPSQYGNLKGTASNNSVAPGTAASPGAAANTAAVSPTPVNVLGKLYGLQTSKNPVSAAPASAPAAATAPAESVSALSPVDKLAGMAAGSPAKEAILKNFGTDAPDVVERFADMPVAKQMEVMSYGNNSIWHYQETANQVDADGQPLWQDSLDVFGDIWQGMSNEGQYTDQDGNIITNSPWDTNGAGQPENNKITPGAGYTWNDARAAAYEWCAKNNVDTSCGLQEAQFNRMQYDLEAAGIIDMVNPQEMQSYLTNPGNTRANAEAFLNGEQVTPSTSSGSWVAVNTDTFLGGLTTAGNSPWDTSDSINNDGTYVPATIYINENASDAYVQQVYNEAWDLYGRTSCYTGRQLKMKVLNYMRDKGAIGWAEYFN